MAPSALRAGGWPSSTCPHAATSQWRTTMGGCASCTTARSTNFQQLRADLQRSGYRFRSDTDTEVLLALYDREGAQMVTRLRGMFAFALWDHPRRRLDTGTGPPRQEAALLFSWPGFARLRVRTEITAPGPRRPSRARRASVVAVSRPRLCHHRRCPRSAECAALPHTLPSSRTARFDSSGVLDALHYRPKRREREEALIDELRERLEVSPPAPGERRADWRAAQRRC